MTATTGLSSDWRVWDVRVTSRTMSAARALDRPSRSPSCASDRCSSGLSRPGGRQPGLQSDQPDIRVELAQVARIGGDYGLVRATRADHHMGVGDVRSSAGRQ
jgi:hypothetical protein